MSFISEFGKDNNKLVFQSICVPYYNYIAFKLYFVIVNGLKMTDYKNRRLIPTYVAILTIL